jgi:hypothetical protein
MQSNAIDAGRNETVDRIEAKLTPEHRVCINILLEHGFTMDSDPQGWTRVYEAGTEALGQVYVRFNSLFYEHDAAITIKAGSYDKPGRCPRVRAGWEAWELDPEHLRQALGVIEQLYFLQSGTTEASSANVQYDWAASLDLSSISSPLAFNSTFPISHEQKNQLLLWLGDTARQWARG